MTIKPGQLEKGFTEANNWSSGLLADMRFEFNIYNTKTIHNNGKAQACTAETKFQSDAPSMNALFEIQLQLDDLKIVFLPSVAQSNDANNFHNIFSTLIKNILETSSYIPRIIHKSLISEYRNHLDNMEEIDAMNMELMQQEKEGELCFFQIIGIGVNA